MFKLKSRKRFHADRKSYDYFPSHLSLSVVSSKTYFSLFQYFTIIKNKYKFFFLPFLSSVELILVHWILDSTSVKLLLEDLLSIFVHSLGRDRI